MSNSKMTKKQKGFWNRFVEFSAMQTAMLHAMPTYFRKNDDEYIDPKEKSSMMECAGAIYGGILGMTLFTGEVISYTFSFMNLAPDTNLNFPFTEQGVPEELLLIPPITNTLSLIYEGIRGKIIERKNRNLEVKIE